jgi:hypothetical protein
LSSMSSLQHQQSPAYRSPSSRRRRPHRNGGRRPADWKADSAAPVRVFGREIHGQPYPFRSHDGCVTNEGIAGNLNLHLKLKWRTLPIKRVICKKEIPCIRKCWRRFKKTDYTTPCPMATGGTTRALRRKIVHGACRAPKTTQELNIAWRSRVPSMPNEEIVLTERVGERSRVLCNWRGQAFAVAQVAGVFDRFERRRTCQMYARFDQWWRLWITTLL